MKPRLVATRRELGLKDPGISNVVEAYKTWVEYPEYLLFQGVNYDEGHFSDPLPGVPSIWISDKVRYTASLASKRGNRKYCKRLDDRLKILDEGMEYSLSFFARGQARKFSSWLFVSLTYARDAPLGEIWQDIGKDYNRWITGIRKKYGKCEVVRTWEAHEDGYPHLHCLLIFHDTEFTVFRYNNKWRIHDKAEFEWRWGWVDVQAVKEAKEAFRYITKYIRKAAARAGWKATLTMALTWFYRKRSWACSRSINDLIRSRRNSNRIASDIDPGLDPRARTVWTWTLLGFWGGGHPPWGRATSLWEFFFDEEHEGFPGEVSSQVFWGLLFGSPTWTDFRYRRRGGDMEIGE